MRVERAERSVARDERFAAGGSEPPGATRFSAKGAERAPGMWPGPRVDGLDRGPRSARARARRGRRRPLAAQAIDRALVDDGAGARREVEERRAVRDDEAPVASARPRAVHAPMPPSSTRPPAWPK